MVTEIKTENRNASLDLARLSALFCVTSVHFFLYNGFYNEPCEGWRMYALTLLRCSFMVCIPLFLLLTGYLMGGRTFSKRHYRGIDKILGVYLLCAVICVAMKKYYFEMPEITWFNVLDFTGCTYGWYVEMYLGLYLLIPLLNLIWRGLEGKRQRQVLIVIFILLTQVPSVANAFDWKTPGAFADPSLSQVYYMLAPRYWTTLYPITYYFIGCWLREYPVTLGQPKNALLYGLSLLLFGSFAFYKSGSGIFISGSWQNWESLLLLPCGVLLFTFFTNLDSSHWRKLPRTLLAYCSECAFGAYLLSCLFDKLFYDRLNELGLVFFDRLKYFPVVLLTLLLSLLASYAVTVAYSLLRAGGDKLVQRIGHREKETVNVR
ncbi:MAG: acyltransferase family protein [Clostridia bacterium]|nr:acyltransferase family protein [Clostridia bacterium]